MLDLKEGPDIRKTYMSLKVSFLDMKLEMCSLAFQEPLSVV
jgi:hypothetical protein